MKNHMRRLLVAATVVTALVTSACTSDAPDAARDAASGSDSFAARGVADLATIARPADLADLAEVELLEPSTTDAGDVPVFVWAAVPEAARYSLTVLGESGPIWAWQGEATEIRLGGYDAEPSSGFGGARIAGGAYWSVAALDDEGTVLALSGLRPVAPDATPVTWTPGESPAASAPEAPEIADNGLHPLLPCDVLGPDAAEQFLGGPLGPVDDDARVDAYWRYCGYALAGNELLHLELGLTQGDNAWKPEADHVVVDGLGEDSYAHADGWGTEIHFLRGPFAVKLSTSYGDKKLDELIELAKALDARIAEATG